MEFAHLPGRKNKNKKVITGSDWTNHRRHINYSSRDCSPTVQLKKESQRVVCVRFRSSGSGFMNVSEECLFLSSLSVSGWLNTESQTTASCCSHTVTSDRQTDRCVWTLNLFMCLFGIRYRLSLLAQLINWMEWIHFYVIIFCGFGVSSLVLDRRQTARLITLKWGPKGQHSWQMSVVCSELGLFPVDWRNR